MSSAGDPGGGYPRTYSAGTRAHPLVPPLALAVITLAGAAVVIGFGHPGNHVQKPIKVVIHYGGGKLPRHRHTGDGPKTHPQKPVKTPRWLAKELGRRSSSAPLVHVVSRDLRITITRRGFRIDYRHAHLTRSATRLGRIKSFVRYAHGVLRRVSFGADATVVQGSVTSSYILVGKRLGARTWTWHIVTNPRPHVRRDGGLLLSGPDSFLIQSPRVYNRTGKDVTPHGVRWQLAREGAGYRISIRLGDKKLPLPYVIAG